MIDFSEENKDSLVHHFASFADKALLKYSKEVAFNELKDLADGYISNEIAMQKGMQEYHAELDKQNKLNHELLKIIKKEKGQAFYNYLRVIIEESDGIAGLAEIVSEPTGTFQKEDYGRTIKGIWVDQWNVGMESDSYAGTVCVQLSEKRFFKFSYSM